MTYLGTTARHQAPIIECESVENPQRRRPLVLIIEDGDELFAAFGNVCDCLDVAVQRVPSSDDLGAVLRRERPMAVIAEMDTSGQDGCHVLMTVAGYDPDIPVLLVAGDDPAILGAIDAVEEIWQLSCVVTWPRVRGIGPIVDYLFTAGRKGDCMRLMPV
jgi:hypothetical protein